MSLFAMGINSLEISEERMRLAEIDLESTTALFDNILSTCKSKCLPPRYGEEDLNKGEMVCIDRCVSKYFKTNLLMGEYMRQNNFDASRVGSYQHTIGTGITSYR